MTPNTSAYERITELVSLLSDYDFEPTVRRISLKTESSLPQTREDLAQLHKLGIRLYPPDVAESLTRTESRYDDVVLELDSDLPVRHSLLFLNKMEQSLLKDNNSGRLLIKDSSLPVSDSVRRHIDRIEEAVRKRCYIRFTYRSPVIGHNEYIEIAPLRLFLNTTDGLFYCITINEDEKMLTYRLDRILFDVHLAMSTLSKAGALRICMKRLWKNWIMCGAPPLKTTALLYTSKWKYMPRRRTFWARSAPRPAPADMRRSERKGTTISMRTK